MTIKIVGGALFKNGKLLVLKRTDFKQFAPGEWEIPGGKLDSGENDEQALVREFLEETTLNIKLIRKFHTMQYDYKGKPAIENDYIIDLTYPENIQINLNPEEHSEFKWISKNDINTLDTTDQMRDCITKAFEINSKFYNI